MTKALWGWAVRPVSSPLQMNISQRQAGPTAAPPCQPVTGKPLGNLTGGECGSVQERGSGMTENGDDGI